MSFGSPCGAPASTQLQRWCRPARRSSERSFLNFWMPTVAIDLPRRHLPIGDARLDRARPRPRFGEGHQRHRRDRIGPVAGLALLLEDRRDVLGERRRLRRVGGRGRRRRAAAQRSTPCTDLDCPSSLCHHVVSFRWLSPSSVIHDSTGRSLSRRYWSSSTGSRRRPRPTRHSPARAACIRPAR